MIIDTSDIAAQNDKHILASQWALENAAFAHASIDVLRTAAYLPLDEPDDITILRLGIRLINSAGAAGISTLNGYYQPAAAHIRDIIEVSFLLDLFRREPSEIKVWREASNKVRYDRFSPKHLKSRLDKADGGKSSYRVPAYKFFSEHGTHAKPSAVGLISPNMDTIVGPFPDAGRVQGLSFDLARHLSAGALFLTKCIGHDRLDQAVPETETYLKAAIAFLDAMEAFRTRTTKPDLPSARA